MKSYTIQSITTSDWPAIIELSDKVFGANYLSLEDLRDFFDESHKENRVCSFVAKDKQNKIVGVRITFAPGHWPQFLIDKSIKKWPTPIEKTAYFKSIFISPAHQGLGIGPNLTSASLEALKNLKVESVVCHAWKESPNNSSLKYLVKMNFKTIGEIQNFWQYKAYSCSRCHPNTCGCTAVEMLKTLKEPAYE